MSADLRIDFGFFDHRKTKRLISQLGLQGAWSLLKLWRKAAETRPKGKLYGMDETDIALDAEWPGDPLEFCKTLLDLHWLDRNGDNVYEVHDWQEHQPWIFGSEERSVQAREAAKIMWDKKRSKSAKKAEKKRTASAPLTDSNAPSPFLSSPIPSISIKERKDIPPDFESVKAYCEQRHNTINAQKFIDHYSARGWMIGKNKMKDWQAAIRTWEENEKENPIEKTKPKEKWELALEGKI